MAVTVLGRAVLRWAARDRCVVAATLLMSCLVLVAY